MLRTITIENYKSIVNLSLELGRLNLLIGENGGGKSNLLEAIAMGSASVSNMLNNEFLHSRGIRVTDPPMMRAAFEEEAIRQPIKLNFDGIRLELQNDNKPYSRWRIHSPDHKKEPLPFHEDFDSSAVKNGLAGFVIYSPESSALRTFAGENQLEPLGIDGSGLFKLLKVLNHESPEKIEEIKHHLSLIGWFADFQIPADLALNETRLRINDRFVDTAIGGYDQKNANEGFLFLLFYITLMVSDQTPKFFAVDNIEASFNPKLCTRLVQELARLAEKYDKQIILTTHNPAALDGVNLNDPEEKILIVSRNKSGHTRVSEARKPKPIAGQDPIKLSEAFLNGMLGGLPKGF